jgi:hypothetical protein
MAQRFFKLVCLNNDQEEWMLERFHSGYVHFGWSWANSDLRLLEEKINTGKYQTLDEWQRLSWSKTRFLKYRLRMGDRLIIQLKRPLREFLLAEITDGYDFLEEPRNDFNHLLHVKPLTDRPVPVTAEYISKSLRHNLSKRGHYYEIYPTESIEELNELIREEKWLQETDVERSQTHELTDVKTRLIKETIQRISRQWPAQYFEVFTQDLIAAIPGVGVKSPGDRGLGWDLTISMEDPVSGEVVADDVPVQCKNYQGEVLDIRAVSDLKRCFQNSTSNIAYLFIIGTLSKDFMSELGQLEAQISQENQRDIKICVVDQERIAELFLQHLHSIV